MKQGKIFLAVPVLGLALGFLLKSFEAKAFESAYGEPIVVAQAGMSPEEYQKSMQERMMMRARGASPNSNKPSDPISGGGGGSFGPGGAPPGGFPGGPGGPAGGGYGPSGGNMGGGNSPGRQSFDLSSFQMKADGPLPLSAIKEVMEGRHAMLRNDRIKIGEVYELDENTAVVDLVTSAGSVIQRIAVDRQTAEMSLAPADFYPISSGGSSEKANSFDKYLKSVQEMAKELEEQTAAAEKAAKKEVLKQKMEKAVVEEKKKTDEDPFKE